MQNNILMERKKGRDGLKIKFAGRENYGRKALLYRRMKKEKLE